MSPGVRTMPAEMALPTATAMPKRRRDLQELAAVLAGAKRRRGWSADEVSAGSGKVKSQGPWEYASSYVCGQKANWK